MDSEENKKFSVLAYISGPKVIDVIAKNEIDAKLEAEQKFWIMYGDDLDIDIQNITLEN